VNSVDLAAFFLYFCSQKSKNSVDMNLHRRYLASLLLAFVGLTVLSAQTIRIGVMLPLNNENSDGKHMVEYYRGVLMACDSLKSLGQTIDVHAWNTHEGANLDQILKDPAAARCDFIIGPFYSRQVRPLSEFTMRHGIKLVIPFSIVAPVVYTNPSVYQIWQNSSDLTKQSINYFISVFKGRHPVFIDCNDPDSQKGTFTFGLRRKLEEMGVGYNLTNLKSAEHLFAKAFVHDQPNVVILNSGGRKELGSALAKIDGLRRSYPDLQIAMLGYSEWIDYTKNYLEQFYKYNVYIPTTYYTNAFSSQTMRLMQKYRWNFHQDMNPVRPVYALSGFDHTMFFVKGLRKYGKKFTGENGQSKDKAVQTPLQFERISNGGYRNRACMLVHYAPDHRIETVEWTND
jgi:hypothetical protein